MYWQVYSYINHDPYGVIIEGNAFSGDCKRSCGGGHLQGGFEAVNLVATAIIVLCLIIASKRFQVLDGPGVISASILGLVVGGLGHWTWLLILLCFLGSSHIATKWRFDEKAAKGMSESNDGHRGWQNVLANGFLPGVVAIIAFVQKDWENGFWIFTAAVSVAAADTWASEFGCLDERVRMITTMKKCEPGVNGGFSPNGQIAALAGSFCIATIGFLFALIYSSDYSQSLQYAGYATIIGFIGCQIDSVLGAVLENRGLMTKGTVNAAAISCGILIMWWALGSHF